MEKESKKSSYLSSRSSSALSRCPLLKVLRTSEYGLVVETSRSFDIGEEMTIGFHVSKPNEGSTFISADSLVVGSELALSERGDFRHRVTLLFSNIACEDREKLMELSNSMPKSSRCNSIGLN
ncbi:MAG: hypothetical protein P1U89_06550 [Verrucomicrobiales bacterium]|nr:hypothetical protein [Verrucomicrobiales bacterium]